MLVPAWLESALRSIGGDQDVVGFLLLAAIIDSKRPAVLGSQELSILIVYFACFFFFPVLTFLDPWTVETDPLPLNVHRWYLYAYLLARLMLACFSLWGVPKEAQCAVLTLLMLCVPHETPDLCRDMDSVSFHVGAALFPSYCGIGESTHSKADKRVIEAESVQCVCRPFEAFYFVYICLFFYFYHYGPFVLSMFRNWKQTFGRGVLYFCSSLIFGYLNTTFFADVGTLEFGTLTWMSFVEVILTLVQVSLLIGGIACFGGKGFEVPGKWALGVYLSHYYFYNAGSTLIKKWLVLALPFGPWAQLLVPLAVCVLFMFTVGRLAHEVLVNLMNIPKRLPLGSARFMWKANIKGQ
jgi:hypothetical protein